MLQKGMILMMQAPIKKITMAVFVFAAIGLCEGDSTPPTTDTVAHDSTANDGTAHYTAGHDSTANDSATQNESTAHESTAHESTAHDSTAKNKPSEGDSLWMLPVLRWIHVLPDSAVVRENTGEIFFGENFYFQRDPHFDHNHIGWSGTVVGIGLPIRVPFVIVHYEVKAYFHQAINGDLSLTYVNGANEINVGKAITFGNIPLDFAPQLGIGFDNGITTRTVDVGIKGMETHYFWYADYGLAIRIAIPAVKFRFFSGLLINYERAFAPNEDTKQRMNIRIIVGY